MTRADQHPDDAVPAQGEPPAERAQPAQGEQLVQREQPAQRASPRRRVSVASMVISLLIVLAIVAAIQLLVVRQNSVTQPPVDVAAGARVAAERVEFTPALPVGLPASWRPTSVRTTTATAQVVTWHAGYVIDGLRYAAVEQGQDAPAEWLRAQTNRGRPDGTQVVGDVVWQRVLRTDKVQNSLVHVRGDVTTVVTGTAGYDELAVLAGALRPPG